MSTTMKNGDESPPLTLFTAAGSPISIRSEGSNRSFLTSNSSVFSTPSRVGNSALRGQGASAHFVPGVSVTAKTTNITSTSSRVSRGTAREFSSFNEFNAFNDTKKPEAEEAEGKKQVKTSLINLELGRAAANSVADDNNNSITNIIDVAGASLPLSGSSHPQDADSGARGHLTSPNESHILFGGWTGAGSSSSFLPPPSCAYTASLSLSSAKQEVATSTTGIATTSMSGAVVADNHASETNATVEIVTSLMPVRSSVSSFSAPLSLSTTTARNKVVPADPLNISSLSIASAHQSRPHHVSQALSQHSYANTQHYYHAEDMAVAVCGNRSLSKDLGSMPTPPPSPPRSPLLTIAVNSAHVATSSGKERRVTFATSTQSPSHPYANAGPHYGVSGAGPKRRGGGGGGGGFGFGSMACTPRRLRNALVPIALLCLMLMGFGAFNLLSKGRERSSPSSSSPYGRGRSYDPIMSEDTISDASIGENMRKWGAKEEEKAQLAGGEVISSFRRRGEDGVVPLVFSRSPRVDFSNRARSVPQFEACSVLSLASSNNNNKNMNNTNNNNNSTSIYTCVRDTLNAEEESHSRWVQQSRGRAPSLFGGGELLGAREGEGGMRKRKDRRPSSPFITGDGFRAACDLVYDETTHKAMAEAVSRALRGGADQSGSGDDDAFRNSPNEVHTDGGGQEGGGGKNGLPEVYTEVFVGDELPSSASSFLSDEASRSKEQTAIKLRRVQSSGQVTPMSLAEVFEGLWVHGSSVSHRKGEGEKTPAVAGADGSAIEGANSQRVLLASLYDLSLKRARNHQQKKDTSGENKDNANVYTERSATPSLPSAAVIFVQTHFIDRFIADILTPLATAVIAVRRKHTTAQKGSDVTDTNKRDRERGSRGEEEEEVLYVPFLRDDSVFSSSSSSPHFSSLLASYARSIGVGLLLATATTTTSYPSSIGFTLVTHNSDYSAPWEAGNTRLKGGIIGRYEKQRSALLDYDAHSTPIPEGHLRGDGNNRGQGHEGSAEEGAFQRMKSSSEGGMVVSAVGSAGVVREDGGNSGVMAELTSRLPRRFVCLRWYAQNTVISHTKLFPIPIGLENRYNKFGKHVDLYAELADNLLFGKPSESAGNNMIHQGALDDEVHGRSLLSFSSSSSSSSSLLSGRERKLFVSFSLKTNPKQRGEALAAAKGLGDTQTTFYNGGTIAKKKKKSKSSGGGGSSSAKDRDEVLAPFLRNMSQHQFVLAPHGHGLDTHRMWEALYMGCVPITGASPIDSTSLAPSHEHRGIRAERGEAHTSRLQDSILSGRGLGAAHDAKLLAYFPVVVLPTLTSSDLNLDLFSRLLEHSPPSSSSSSSGPPAHLLGYSQIVLNAALKMQKWSSRGKGDSRYKQLYCTGKSSSREDSSSEQKVAPPTRRRSFSSPVHEYSVTFDRVEIPPHNGGDAEDKERAVIGSSGNINAVVIIDGHSPAMSSRLPDTEEDEEIKDKSRVAQTTNLHHRRAATSQDALRLFLLEGMLNMNWWIREVRDWWREDGHDEFDGTREEC